MLVAAVDPHGGVRQHGHQDAQANILELQAALTGRSGDLLDWMRRYLLRNPLDTRSIYDLAWYEQQTGHLDESAATYRKLLELNPAYATAHAQYGLTLLMMGKNSEALAATEKDSDDASKLATLACVYWATGRRAESDSALGTLERGFADRNEYLVAGP